MGNTWSRRSCFNSEFIILDSDNMGCLLDCKRILFLMTDYNKLYWQAYRSIGGDPSLEEVMVVYKELLSDVVRDDPSRDDG